MSAPPQLVVADAGFVTDRLLVGGDLDTRDDDLAGRQLAELLHAGLTHILDTRIEWTDESWVRERAPGVAYLHHGMDDAGQEVAPEWFDVAVGWAQDAIDGGGTVLTHCHMGVNRGPSLGFAVLLGQGLDPIEALGAIRAARPVAWVAYADAALRWRHARIGSGNERLAADRARVARWREDHELDLAEVIRAKRAQGW